VILRYFSKICLQNSGFINIRLDRYFTRRQVYILSYNHSNLLRIRNVSGKFVKKIKKHILCSLHFFSSEIVPFKNYCGKILHSRTVHKLLWENIAQPDSTQVTVGKYCTAGQYTSYCGEILHSRTVHELLWENIAQPDSTRVTVGKYCTAGQYTSYCGRILHSRTVHELLWENIAQPDSTRVTVALRAE
jgi:hypothetical protein